MSWHRSQRISLAVFQVVAGAVVAVALPIETASLVPELGSATPAERWVIETVLYLRVHELTRDAVSARAAFPSPFS
jgi:hypothetical protein